LDVIHPGADADPPCGIASNDEIDLLPDATLLCIGM